jgi:hypothetical protein
MKIQFGKGNLRRLLESNRGMHVMDKHVEDQSIEGIRLDQLKLGGRMDLLKDSRSAHFLHLESRIASESPRQGSNDEGFSGAAKAPARRNIYKI